MTGLAIIAGRGALPVALARALPTPPVVAAMEGFLPDGLAPDLVFRLERLVPMLLDLADRGVGRVVFAGAVARPRLDPALFDPATAALVPRLLGAMGQGDDATLRAILAIFADEGFETVGVADIAPDLIPGPGLLAGRLRAVDESDAARAAQIVQALGAVDVGQGAVVQSGLCLAVETIAGTDAMLAQVAGLPAHLRPDPQARGGVIYKAPKPGQDMRIDLPTLGPATVAHAAEAGLSGIAFAAGGVICLDRDRMIHLANEAGLFLWARA